MRAILLLPLLVATIALAEGPPAKAPAHTPKPGWAVNIDAGVFVSSIADNEWTRGNSRITSLEARPEASRWCMVFPRFDARYTFASGKTSVYLGNPLGEQSRLGLGVRTESPMGEVDLSASILDLVIQHEVWKNPYLVNIKREATPVSTINIKAGLNRPFGMPARLSVFVSPVDVKDDQIGQLMPDLDRDGTVHSASAHFTIPINQQIKLDAGLSATSADMQGQSQSYDGLDPSLTLRYTSADVIASAGYGVKVNEYRKPHPIFNADRTDKTYTAMLNIIKPGVFSLPNARASIGIMLSRTESTITFFEKQRDSIFAGVGYGFK